MNKLIEVVVRAVIQALAGAVMSNGVQISDSNIDQIAGAMALIVTVIWSIWSKNKAKAHEKTPDSAGSR